MKSKYHYDENSWTALERTMAPGRLRLYLEAAKESKERAFKLYIWNLEICKSLYTPLHYLEVSLRNRTDGVLTEVLGNDWYNSSEFRPREKSTLRHLKYRLAKGRTWTANDINQELWSKDLRDCLPQGVDRNNVIAGLPFDFWVVLFKDYYDKLLWQGRLKIVFPKLPDGVSLQDIYGELKKLRQLRNSVAHYEPIFDLQLKEMHKCLSNLLKWICPVTGQLMQRQDNFRRTWNKGANSRRA